jgi:hypothetical protein
LPMRYPCYHRSAAGFSWSQCNEVICGTLPWPIALLDDLAVATATRIARNYDALVVHTSPQGGCHLWLLCGESLDKHERYRAQ